MAYRRFKDGDGFSAESDGTYALSAPETGGASTSTTEISSEAAASVTPYSAVDNMQPSIVIPTLISTSGVFPTRDDIDGTTASGDFLGQIHHLAAPGFEPGGTSWLQGDILPLSTNTALFSLLGTQYGGDGKTNFALPDSVGQLTAGQGWAPFFTQRWIGDKFGSVDHSLLVQELPAHIGGGSQPYDHTQPTLTTNYVITVNGTYMGSSGTTAASELLGAVWQFGGNFAPPGTMFCEGQILQIAEWETLFTLIGTTYGGDGVETFALPDLRGRTVVHAGNGHTLGQTFGTEETTITGSGLPSEMGFAGTPLNNVQPSLVLNYMIAYQGVFPSMDGTGSFPDNAAMLSEIVAYAGPASAIPDGWALANGQLMPINTNQALFSLVGTTYGGNGMTTFALPDLRGRAIIGTGDGYDAGETYGSDTITLTAGNMPPLNFSGTEADNTLYGGDSDDIVNGLGGNDTIYGRLGNDILIGGAGDDTLDGMSGTDTASYATATAGVVADLRTTGPQNTVGAGSDTFVAIENLTGSAFDDSLFGDDFANALDGGAGNDSLVAGGGADTLTGGVGDDYLDGGDGTDTVTYAGASSAVTVDLSAASASGGEGNDIIGAVENVIGSAFDDVLVGDSFANVLEGGSGADSLNGNGGIDTLIGGTGNDIFYADSDDTIIEGLAGGTDEVRTTASSFTLAANVESLSFVGSGNFTGTGGSAGETFASANSSMTSESSYTILAGGGADTLYGNGLAGNMSLNGEAGDDVIAWIGETLAPQFVNDGGDGSDTLVLQGDFTLDLSADNFRNFETLSLLGAAVTTYGASGLGDNDYDIAMADDNVAAGQNLVVDGSTLAAGEDLTFDGSAETDGTFLVYAGAGTNALTGGAGSDGFFFGALLGSDDSAHGGDGVDDQVGLQGDYSAGLTIDAANFTGIETFALLAGNDSNLGTPPNTLLSYDLTTSGSFGRNVIVNANGLRSGENLTFDGSAETTGSFTFYGGLGTENLTGGGGNDGFYFGPARFGAGTVLAGGGGADNQLGLRGDYNVDFNAAGFDGIGAIQTIALLSDLDPNYLQIGDGEFDYTITLADYLVGDGQQLTVTGGGLGATETMVVDGSAETDGSLRLIGGASQDVLTGGSGDDLLFGGAGTDTLTGGDGADTFVYASAGDSTPLGRDGIQDFTDADTIMLSPIDADATTGIGDAFTFIGSDAFSGTAGELRVVATALPIWTVSADTDGDGAADLEFIVVVSDGHALTAADFIL